MASLVGALVRKPVLTRTVGTTSARPPRVTDATAEPVSASQAATPAGAPGLPSVPSLERLRPPTAVVSRTRAGRQRRSRPGPVPPLRLEHRAKLLGLSRVDALHEPAQQIGRASG